MSDTMSLSINGQFQVPPGFRFHPTEEELLQYYLRKKVSYEKIELDAIREVDLNKLEPWDIQEKCKIGSTPQSDWYFFSHKDKKYPTGMRTNRATAAGFWKATGRDKVIYSYSTRIGMRKTLVFYQGRAPHGQKSDWIMHEYRLDDNTSCDITNNNVVSNAIGESTQEEGWVVCRIFKKKNLHKTLERATSDVSITAESRSQKLSSGEGGGDEGTLEQIFEYMGRTYSKEENEANSGININGLLHDRFIKLPPLFSPNSPESQTYQPIHPHLFNETDHNSVPNHFNADGNGVYSDWAAIDRLVASRLNGQSDTSKQLSTFGSPTTDHDLQLQQQLHSSAMAASASSNSRQYFSALTQDCNSDQLDLWSFIGSSFSSTEPKCQMPNATI